MRRQIHLRTFPFLLFAFFLSGYTPTPALPGSPPVDTPRPDFLTFPHTSLHNPLGAHMLQCLTMSSSSCRGFGCCIYEGVVVWGQAKPPQDQAP